MSTRYELRGREIWDLIEDTQVSEWTHGVVAKYATELMNLADRRAVERAAQIARLAPGQDWSDGTTPEDMARFIAESIEGRK